MIRKKSLDSILDKSIILTITAPNDNAKSISVQCVCGGGGPRASPPLVHDWPCPNIGPLRLTYPIQKCNICYNKLAKILIFDSFCLGSFSAKQCQKWLVQLSQKLVKVVPHAQQQLLILWSDILTMKCTPANFIGHLWAKSSIEITFHHSQKDICPIWVGFFKLSSSC